MTRRRKHQKPPRSDNPFQPRNGNPFQEKALDPHMLGAVVRQMVTQEIMAVTNQFISHINELAMSHQASLSMIEVLRRLLVKKGVITTEEFMEMSEEMHRLTRRAHEIANDSDTPEEDRVKMIVEECGIQEDAAKEIIEHAKQATEGLSSLMEAQEEGEEDEPGEDASGSE